MEGWIDEVDDGIVYGRVICDGQEMAFWTPLRLISDSARVDLQPGSYVTIRDDDSHTRNCNVRNHGDDVDDRRHNTF